ncbi:hypothetical protein HUT16_06305 [Kitasatospora sp. NA04385]|uniref:hypothetical protein n=1 Tax=Kitasatospora sp. NA04385 TaxID=2742135 RepID=UPI001592690C|nr:hypothetical protein [Kitasatospora sp. NA04385]QKW18725.1 hypothetical protein HUT16_06305 [Kitasatospora sp. NA04385]
MRIRAIVTACLVAALALSATGCDPDEDDRARNAQDAGPAAVGDVEVTSCKVDDELQWPSATVRITNHTATTSNYVVQIAFEDHAGRQVTEGVAAAGPLPPGQDALEHAQGTADPHGPVSCRVTDVARYASP